MYKEIFFIIGIILFGNIMHLNCMSAEKKFTEIFKKNLWHCKTSVSGIGSAVPSTKDIRRELPVLFKQYGIKKIIDAACGDFIWMKEIDLKGYDYSGFDIVKELVEKNNQLYKSDTIQFYAADLICDVLPQGDVIIARDILVHLPIKDIFKTINNFKKSKSKYLLVTTFNRQDALNHDIELGKWRLLNLQLAPFNFPKPLAIIDEKRFGKCLALYKLDDIRVGEE